MIRRRAASLAIPILCLLAARSSRSAEPLEARVEAVLKTPTYSQGAWGVLVVEVKTGKVVFEKNADRMFCPASVTKLFSCASALTDLGPDYRFKTRVVRRGDVSADGTLSGDLILVASGDLSLGGRTGPEGTLLFEDNDHSYAGGSFKATLVPANPRGGLDYLAREIKDAGIKRVTGEVIVDDRLFESAPSTGSGPSRVSPMVVNDNVIDVRVTPAARAGEPATVAIVPETAFATFETSVETVPEGVAPSLDVISQAPRRFSVRGKLPVGHKPAVKIYEVQDPASFARTMFLESLRGQGIKVSASPLADNPSGDLPMPSEVAKLAKVAEYTSPPFSEYIKVILKVSQNLHASTLPLLVAAHHGEKTLADGLRREGTLLQELGVDTSTIAFGGGAGGARADLVTPRATVALLRSMTTRPGFPAYEAALPILGRDGTLATAVPTDSPAKGHVRAKTGTYWVGNGLNGRAILTSKALAGYMETASGKNLAFAFFVNNVPLATPDNDVTEATAEAGRLLGKLCEVFYADAETPTSPTPPKAAAEGK